MGRRAEAGVSKGVDVLPERLKQARIRMGWSRETLAHRSGLSFAAISQIETGRRTNVRPGTLMALADALGVTVDHLVGAPGDRGLLSHRALIYRSRDDLAGAIAPVLRGAIDQSGTPLVVTTPANIELLGRALGEDAGLVRFEASREWYRTPIDTLTAYRGFVEDQTVRGASWVNIVGEPVWASGEVADWERYEAAINLIFAALPATVTCLYDAGSLDPSVAETARRTHPSLLSTDGSAPNPSYVDPARFLFG